MEINKTEIGEHMIDLTIWQEKVEMINNDIRYDYIHEVMPKYEYIHKYLPTELQDILDVRFDFDSKSYKVYLPEPRMDIVRKCEDIVASKPFIEDMDPIFFNIVTHLNKINSDKVVDLTLRFLLSTIDPIVEFIEDGKTSATSFLNQFISTMNLPTSSRSVVLHMHEKKDELTILTGIPNDKKQSFVITLDQILYSDIARGGNKFIVKSSNLTQTIDDNYSIISPNKDVMNLIYQQWSDLNIQLILHSLPQLVTYVPILKKIKESQLSEANKQLIQENLNDFR